MEQAASSQASTLASVPPQQPSTLSQKLSEILATVESIPKRGHNANFNYDFVREADALDGFRDAMAQRNVFLYSSVQDVVEERYGDGGKNLLTTARMEFLFVDGDTGEERAFSWFGRGLDTQDKGLAKAVTSALKTFLLKTFLVPTDTDPDQDVGDGGTPSRRTRKVTESPKGGGASGEDNQGADRSPADAAPAGPHTHAYVKGVCKVCGDPKPVRGRE